MNRAAVLSFLLGVVLTSFAMGNAAAQSKDSKDSKYSSDPLAVGKIHCSTDSGGMNVQTGWNGVTTPQPTGDKWQVEFRIKSQCDKQVSAIFWSFRFVNRDKKVIIEDFKSKRSVKPGKEATVTESFGYDAKLMPEALEGNVLIRRVEFQDGTVWEPEPSKSDSMLTGPQQ